MCDFLGAVCVDMVDAGCGCLIDEIGWLVVVDRDVMVGYELGGFVFYSFDSISVVVVFIIEVHVVICHYDDLFLFRYSLLPFVKNVVPSCGLLYYSLAVVYV